MYERMVSPLVEDFLKGKSGMLTALGPSGSGKTHTIFGSPRVPGMVPLALQHIFRTESSDSKTSRYLATVINFQFRWTIMCVLNTRSRLCPGNYRNSCVIRNLVKGYNDSQSILDSESK